MKVGMHFSIAGGLAKSLDRAGALDCQGLQIFLQNPRGWRWRPIPESEIQEFCDRRRQRKIELVVVHLSYLPNLAAADGQLYERSWNRLRQELSLAKSLQIDYLVCHPGHAASNDASLSRIAQGLNQTVVVSPPPPLILLENTSGQKNELGASINELYQIMSRAVVPVGLCLDTAHAFAAGYNLRLAAGRKKLLDEIAAGCGLACLKVIHLNDSLVSCGSHRDRHWHLGRGAIGLRALREFLRSCPPGVEGVILETPKKQSDDDSRNLTAARKILNQLAKE
ncbi:MAG TPA: hypothetical protein DCY27_12545 [Desulfobacterales bacterium]|nr:hypothetical protein [Desulfobacterales bacterium]